MQDIWKGKIWYLAFTWPFYGYGWTKDFFNYDEKYASWIQAGICAGWIIFMASVIYAIILIRKELK